jgi:hypothetical protein
MHTFKLVVAASAASLSLWACGGGSGNNISSNGAATTTPVKILFVGNSYTFARVAPALQYNAANVHDLTAGFNATDPTGTNSYPVGSGIPPNPCAQANTGCFEPHNWGGVPGIFKKLTDQALLNYDVSLSTRNAATLRGHFLNTANAAWDMRSNIASQKWDVVVLQGQSDEPLPAAKAKNGNPVSFTTYVNQIERYVHVGTGGATTEVQIFGSLANCTAATSATPPGPGLSATSCNMTRNIPTNSNANPAAKVYLFQGWARPDMVEAHKCTTPDLTTTNGAPIVDPTCAAGSNGSTVTGQNTIYYTAKASTALNLKDMTTDMHNVFYGLLTTNTGLTDVVAVGDAFQRAVDGGGVKADNFYFADGTFNDGGLPNLWWQDRTHPSVRGAYLSALMMLGKIAKVDPANLGTADRVFGELGISSSDALMLQKAAHDTLVAGGATFKQ